MFGSLVLVIGIVLVSSSAGLAQTAETLDQAFSKVVTIDSPCFRAILASLRQPDAGESDLLRLKTDVLCSGAYAGDIDTPEQVHVAFGSICKMESETAGVPRYDLCAYCGHALELYPALDLSLPQECESFVSYPVGSYGATVESRRLSSLAIWQQMCDMNKWNDLAPYTIPADATRTEAWSLFRDNCRK